MSYQRVAIKWSIFFFFFVYFRDPKDQGEIRVTWAIMVREDRKDTVDSLACRVFLDLRYVQAVLVSSLHPCLWNDVRIHLYLELMTFC